MACAELFKAGTPVREVHIYNYPQLHGDGRRLIRSWFRRSQLIMERHPESVFEPFIFAWFAFNGWGMCVTEADNDAVMIKSLALDQQMTEQFETLLAEPDSVFADSAKNFVRLLPIFDVKALTEAGILRFDNEDRAKRVNFYLTRGATEYDPKCWKRHADSGEATPLDWAHTLKAIYKVRCNLFHGRKSAHSEMDRRIVSAALYTLVHFIEEAGYI
jgi:hypothetical protein